MPKKDDTPELAVCDGCGRQAFPEGQMGRSGGGSFELAEPDRLGHRYCPDCAERRADDPAVTVQGRALTVSELMMQAEDDKDLAAVLPGDSLQEQINNKQALADVRALAEKWQRGEK